MTFNDDIFNIQQEILDSFSLQKHLESHILYIYDYYITLFCVFTQFCLRGR